MNQTFSLSRFGRLLYKYLSDNRGQLLTSLAMLTGILLVGALLFYTGLPSQVDRNRGAFLFLVGWFAWFIFTWMQVEVLNHRERSINYLLQPASQLEKFLLIWVISGVGFLTVYLLLFTVVDAVGVGYVNSRNWTPEQLSTIRQVDGVLRITLFYKSEQLLPPAHILVLTGLLHPVCLATFLFVKRYSLPIVSVVIVIVLVTGFFINFYTVKAMLSPAHVVSVLPLESPTVKLPASSVYRTIDLPQPLGDIIRYATGITGIVLLYVIAFFRLKEREV